jgi:hypothetical protein
MKLQQWLGQATTGAGFATVLAGAGALATGTASWQQAVPLVIAGVAGLIWPENTGLQSAAKQSALDIESLVAAYQAAKAAPPPATAAGTPAK